MNYIIYNFIKRLLVIYCLFTSVALADEPITIDNRIKTYLYNESEVFRLLVHYGYQTNIEFALGEKVKTISLGDNYAWKISPVGRRLFIRPLQENLHTNMTVITNMRTYQFDLLSKKASDKLDNELVYVLRFFYPTDLNQENGN